jgi:hypothetical protein
VNVFRCTGEPFAFWLETIDADAAQVIEMRNAAHGSMYIEYVGMNSSVQTWQSQAHPRDTIRTGSGADEILGTIEIFGMKRPISGKAAYSYSSEMTVLADEEFARIDFVGSVFLPPPMGEMRGSGTFLYSDRLDLLIEDETRLDYIGAPKNYRLARLSLPGQKGFGDETPGVGCGEMSQLSTRQTGAPA